MAEIEFPGTGSGSKSKLPYLLVGVGALVLVILMRRGGGSSPGFVQSFTPPDRSADIELASIAAQSSRDLFSLNAGNLIEQQRIQSEQKLALANSPESQKTCIPWAKWWGLSSFDVKQFTSQAANGKILLTPSAEGMCIVPTYTGLRGAEPNVVTKESVGLLKSSKSIIGPGGSYQPNTTPARGPVLGDLAKTYLAYQQGGYLT
jgi:hypothetical protein